MVVVKVAAGITVGKSCTRVGFTGFKGVGGDTLVGGGGLAAVKCLTLVGFKLKELAVKQCEIRETESKKPKPKPLYSRRQE